MTAVYFRWIVAALHLLALGVGLGAVWARARALRGAPGPDDLRRAFYADTLWGLAALVWIATGLWRAFGGLERGTAYYLANHAFHVKMGLLVLVLALEIWPAVTLVRWRGRVRRGEAVEAGAAGRIATISVVQAVLVVGMVLAATAMARGMGL